MGRDVGFADDELSSYRGDVVVICYDIKTHRTGYHFSDDPYEDYGVLLWLDKDGNPKRKGKKFVMLEEECYQPLDFVKKWDVLVGIGDYGVEVINKLQGDHLGRKLNVFQVKNIYREGKDFRLSFKTVGQIHKDSLEIISTEEIHDKFEEKLWKGIKKAIKIPKKITEKDE